jgi:pyruvate dehydrogenase E1 component
MSQLDSDKISHSAIQASLSDIENYVLWNAINIVHHANNVRPNIDKSKVGGHQASSASISTIMTTLFFDFMRPEDKISVKPHGSPIFHAIQYLLGNLPEEYMTRLRDFQGLQAYPSRTKDPDKVDFSTGSVGLGSIAPNFASLVKTYINSRDFSESNSSGRYISIVGDAELDEGTIWEAIAEPEMVKAKNLMWIIDLNRQSLDRIIPGIRVNAWRDMFVANGWNVIEAKYGQFLESVFLQPNGELLKAAIDEMSNEAYQRLLRVSPNILRTWIPKYSKYPDDISKLLSNWDDNDLHDLFNNLGGHDFGTLRQAFAKADLTSKPSVVFAYTLKGYALPSEGDPQNHSVLLSNDQMEQLRHSLQMPKDIEWPKIPTDTVAGKLVDIASSNFNSKETSDPISVLPLPNDFGRSYKGVMSTQQIFGLILTDISRNLDDISDRVVTVSPDVASSTNLGGWINKVGVWNTSDDEILPDEEVTRALKWEESSSGQHIELGISENNLFMMLGQLGLSHEMENELLFPIGTLYDPFIRRGLDSFVYGVYSGSKFIVVGTPSGLTLGPEGGAHQSIMTPSIGMEMPTLDSYEPCFGQELEWIVLSSLDQIRQRKRSTYLRLTSKFVDQTLFPLPDKKEDVDLLRRQVLKGAYSFIDIVKEEGVSVNNNVINLAVCGSMIPEAYEATQVLKEEGIYVSLINITGPGPLYREYTNIINSSVGDGNKYENSIQAMLPGAYPGSPVVTVIDGHPHSLSWIGSALGSKTLSLGVSDWGQSGSRADLYQEYGIDKDSIVSACISALDL